MPFPYPEIIDSSRGGGDGSAVSLPRNNRLESMINVTIDRLIVGKRHCRLLPVKLTYFKFKNLSKALTTTGGQRRVFLTQLRSL